MGGDLTQLGSGGCRQGKRPHTCPLCGGGFSRGDEHAPRVLEHVTIPMQNAYMSKEAALTVRVPRRLKQQLEERARREHRSVSGQVVEELARALAGEPAGIAGERLPVLGRYRGARLPSDEDFVEARTALWGGLERRRG